MISGRIRRAVWALLVAVASNILVFGALGALNRARPLPPVSGEVARLTVLEPPPLRARPPEPERMLDPEPPPPETLAEEPVELEMPTAELCPLDLALVAPDVTVPALWIAPVAARKPRRIHRPREKPARPAPSAARRQPREETFGSDEVDRPPCDLDIARPAYPAYARRRGLEGWVTLKLLVNGEGRAEKVEVVEVRGFAGFKSAVLQVVDLWRFTAPRHRGRRVKVWAVKTVRFRLEGPRG